MNVRYLFLTILLLTLSSAPAFAQGHFGAETRLTDIIVKIEPGALTLPPQVPDAEIRQVSIHRPEVADVLAQHGATHVLRSFPGASAADTVLVSEFGQRIRLIDRTRVLRFRFPVNAPLEAIAEQLSRTPGIVFAYRIPQYELAALPAIATEQVSVAVTPNDPHFGTRQWNLHHTGSGFQPPVTSAGRADIRALEAWDLFKGSPNVRIGIIDTGMLLGHEDLSGRVTGDSPAATGSPSYDSHGTHVGGIAGALTDNAKGIAGVDWFAQIISRNVHPFSPEVIYDKIISAANAGSHIMNNSWGTTAGQTGTDHLV
jgi:subtilisin family serine protease